VVVHVYPPIGGRVGDQRRAPGLVAAIGATLPGRPGSAAAPTTRPTWWRSPRIVLALGAHPAALHIRSTWHV